jgi:GT2 family glycosyltransferase/2-polyprenyl-3-methyl-5-hydroxy-6-metoxy-1,4-benzoquinol methylase
MNDEKGDVSASRGRAQLEAVIERVRNSKGAIIFLPAVSWKIHLFQRPHHLAREFAQLGYISIFHTTYSQDGVDGFEEIERNLFLFYGADDLLYKIPDPFLWAFTYNYHRRAEYPPSAKVVYDLVDDPDLFPLDAGLLERNHSQALQEAMLVTGVSRRLCEQTSVARPDILYLPNGVEYFHFASHRSSRPDDPEITEILEEGKPIAGYYGALAEWFDYDLLSSVADLRPDWNFLLIGAIYDQSVNERGKELLNRSNVFWIGSRDYSLLPDYLQSFDVAAIPFVINNITLSCSPIKMYEFLAGGKPVIATPIPECQAIPDVHIVRDAEEFSQALDLAREQGLSQDFRRRLSNLARKNSWSARAQLVSEHIQSSREKDSLDRRLAEKDVVMGSIRQSYLENRQIAEELLVELAEKNHIITSLSGQKIKQEQSLVAQIAEKEQGILSLSSELANKREAIKALSSQAAEAEQNARSLASELAKEREQLQALLSQASEADQQADSLAWQLTRKERSIEVLLEQLSVKDDELERITNTLGWRVLSRYGQIKYRYLLPIYKALGLPPYNKKRVQDGQTDQSPLDQLPDMVQTIDFSSELDSPALTRPLSEKLAWQVPTESNAYDVICFPIIDWDFRFQRPQQLMSRFAAAGHRVFYISQNFYSSGPPYLIQEKQENIFEISLRGPVKNVYRDVMDDQARDSLFDSLDALRRDVLLAATVAVVQLPFWWPLVNKVRSRFAWPSVYDCMDFHAGFSTNEKTMIDQEHDLLTSADLVVVSSNFLEEQARPYNSNVLMVRNACEYEHFAKAGKTRNQRPVIGYYGAIADWFDADLVADLAERRPDWDFLLVGSTFSADISRLSKLGNVSLPGEKPYAEIPDWLGRFDVAIIPFQRTPLTEATNPVKAYEILASGKPIVCVPIPEVAALAPLVRLASTAEEFEQEIVAALNENDPQLIEIRRAFAKEHTWEKRYEVLAPAIRKIFPKASIIIVTYNNVHLNRLCLESLYRRTEWPNFEVIVIDNASADGTPQYLMEAQAALPNLSVILNDENLGFAAANNIGLKQASGEYLLLLNNDTVLTRGWLSALIRHLHADPGIGIIGPVTNEIGNEAKVEVGYQQLEEMPGWAANFVRANDSQLFAINVLAMFCVAMRSEVFAQIGLIDESFQIGMFEDDDYTRRIRDKGYKVICAPDSFIHHAGGASFKLLSSAKYQGIFQRNRRVYEEKWGLWEPHQDRKAREWIPDLCNRLRKIVKKSGVDAKRIVVFLPSISWNSALAQRPHHLASELARQGFLVFFDCSGILVDQFSGFVQIRKNLWIYNGPKGVLDSLEHSILWTLPYNVRLAERWENPTIIYDWIDDLSVLPYKQSWLQENHEKMLASADLVLCVARNLLDQAREKRPDALYVQNGVEYERFSSPASSIELDLRFKEMVDQGRPIVGYYGAIASWFDVDLLVEVAELRADWNFVIIGHRLADAPSLKALEDKPNVLVLQVQTYESLPGYLAQFTVATIPFKVNQNTVATSPLTLYEYFAGGKPVISTPLPECESYEEVRIVRDAQEFSRALDAASASSRDPKTKERLLSLGRENSWTMRVQVVVAALSKKTGSYRTDHQQPLLDTSGAASNGNTEIELDEDLDEGNEVAQQFRHFKTPRNEHFFKALTRHLSALTGDSGLPMYFENAITCNERGRVVANLLQKHTTIGDKRYLDIGCAYGGFLVAFAEQGAQVTGIDNDQALLNLAKYNLMDNHLDVRLLARDATRASDLTKFHASFDIITCNDVIEHVADPQALLRNISDMLASNGLAYFEIPNRYYARFVLQDGHYQLFGITLLDYPDAKQYYSLHAPGSAYTVRHYLGIDQYAKMFSNAGLELTILPETFEGLSIDLILNDVAELRANAETELSKVPGPLRERVSQYLSSYLQEVEAQPRATDLQQRDFKLHYGTGFWRVLGRKAGAPAEALSGTGHLAVAGQSGHNFKSPPLDRQESPAASSAPVQSPPKKHYARFKGMSSHPGRCCICGNHTLFFYSSKELYRESLTCGNCLSTSRYRSIARGILRAIRDLTGLEARSIAELDPQLKSVSLKIYDTQVPFYYETCAYPIPDLLSRCKWIDLQTSMYRSQQPYGKKLGSNLTNQNLEALTFRDNSFDIVITSDVMEHVRLDDQAHQEIRRVLKPGGIYLFTVPHFRHQQQTFFQVAVKDPLDPTKDVFLTEKEYHGDANAKDGKVLSYRAYGTELDKTLHKLGFTVDYCKTDYPEMGIMNTELFYCQLGKG